MMGFRAKKGVTNALFCYHPTETRSTQLRQRPFCGVRDDWSGITARSIRHVIELERENFRRAGQSPTGFRRSIRRSLPRNLHPQNVPALQPRGCRNSRICRGRPGHEGAFIWRVARTGGQFRPERSFNNTGWPCGSPRPIPMCGRLRKRHVRGITSMIEPGRSISTATSNDREPQACPS